VYPLLKAQGYGIMEQLPIRLIREVDYLNQIDDFYSNYYTKIFGAGLIGKMSDFVHWILEKPYKHSEIFGTVLEVGAGYGQHSKFVKHRYDCYIETDIRESNYPHSNNRIKRLISDAENLTEIESNSIDRLIATCILAHLTNPEKALQNWKRVVKKKGHLSIYVPVEPSILLRLFRSVATTRKAKKMGLNHKSIHYREHRNMWIYCDLLIRETFHGSNVKSRRFPVSFLPWNLRLFDIYEITK
jgi:SAM-dependent methyltransferase